MVTQRVWRAVLAAGVLVVPALNAQNAPSPDPRVGLRAGLWDAAQAAWNLRLVSTSRPAPQFIPATPGDFDYMNSDLAFTGHYVIQGNFQGFSVWDVADPARPTLVHAETCPEQQNDVSIYKNLLFLSGESGNGRVDCGTQGVSEHASPQRFRGVRVINVSDFNHPRILANVQTCRGSHTHTLVTDPKDTTVVYIYVSGQAPVRPAEELAGCSSALPAQDTSSARFRIDIIRVPLAHPESASVVSRPRIFEALVAPPTHGASPTDSAAGARFADSARAAGAYVVKFQGMPVVAPPPFVNAMLDSIVKSRGGTGAPTAADSTALRGGIQGIVDAMFKPPLGPNGQPLGPDQCHDITVYPEVGLAGGACAGYGLLLDLSDPAHPVRLAAASDSNFAYWHSATFSNDAGKALFTDEWGGGVAPRCRVTDKPQWGADAIFTVANRALTFKGYYKLPAPQTSMENCVAHNGNLIPVPGRDIMVQGWYQGGVSVFDFTDPAHPTEIAFFDRGPMDSTKLEMAGSWGAYWYNGYIYSSEIARGLDVLELQPNAMLTQNELDAAKLVKVAYHNPQDQQRLTWPASFVVARAYLDQLERSRGLSADRISAARTMLASAERTTSRAALTSLATAFDRDAASSRDAARVSALAGVVRALAK
ncbi:MAG: hypothetical protein DMD66_00345 [Gemmatimonadetes bacterium]|nr:MAG: hypothetical protein DMD66_00345 [Gemmatimonadota bacterium]